MIAEDLIVSLSTKQWIWRAIKSTFIIHLGFRLFELV